MITRASFRGHVAVGEFHTDRDTYLGRDTYLLTAIPPSACEITNIAELPSRVGTSISGRSTGPPAPRSLATYPRCGAGGAAPIPRERPLAHALLG